MSIITRHGLTHKGFYWACIHPDFPYGETAKEGGEWVAHSTRNDSVSAHFDTLLEAAQWLYYGD